jgi:hypothetical protein
VSNNCDVPDDPDQVFSAGLQYKVRKNGTIKYLRIFATTVRLIWLICENKKLLTTDATHKTNWQGYPVILMGTVDLARHFHPYGLLLSSK